MYALRTFLYMEGIEEALLDCVEVWLVYIRFYRSTHVLDRKYRGSCVNLAERHGQ